MLTSWVLKCVKICRSFHISMGDYWLHELVTICRTFPWLWWKFPQNGSISVSVKICKHWTHSDKHQHKHEYTRTITNTYKKYFYLLDALHIYILSPNSVIIYIKVSYPSVSIQTRLAHANNNANVKTLLHWPFVGAWVDFPHKAPVILKVLSCLT